MMITQKIHDAIAAVCPIAGVSIVALQNKATWSIVFHPSATQEQKDAAFAAVNSFDVNAELTKEAADDAASSTDTAAAKADNAITALKAMTPAQARAWVNTNVNSLADAKQLLGTMAAVICVLARRL